MRARCARTLSREVSGLRLRPAGLRFGFDGMSSPVPGSVTVTQQCGYCNLLSFCFTRKPASASAFAMSDRDTIFALSSGRPPVAIAVVRISGPRAGAALQALIGKVPEPRRAVLARVRDPQSGEIIDQAVALFFPGPQSETGEDIGRAATAWRARGDRRRAGGARARSTACARRRPANSPAAPSRTASSI